MITTVWTLFVEAQPPRRGAVPTSSWRAQTSKYTSKLFDSSSKFSTMKPEYEVLLSGLWFARELQVQDLTVFSDLVGYEPSGGELWIPRCDHDKVPCQGAKISLQLLPTLCFGFPMKKIPRRICSTDWCLLTLQNEVGFWSRCYPVEPLRSLIWFNLITRFMLASQKHTEAKN